MNEIAIGIRYNDKVNLIGASWPKLATLKAIARLEIARLKRNARDLVERVAITRIIDRVAMAFNNPMPTMALT